MKTSIRKLIWILGAGAIALLPLPSAWAQQYSHARIVRLSFTEGTVAIQRPNAQGWASAPVNTPIQEGFQLSTADNSYAEVEFENSSMAWIGQNSLLEFPLLALDANGGKLNHLVLTQGYATFEFIREDGDQDQVVAGPVTITLASGGTARFRADLVQGAVRVEVFKGRVKVSSAFGAQTLTSEMKMVVNPSANPPMEVTRGIVEDAWDKWVDERYAEQLARRNQPTPGIYSPNVSSMFGWGDLCEYGNWIYLPGYGYGWMPTQPSGWSPYVFGRWSWYPGFGYTWISFEPWGWLPYHYGGWTFQPGFGWVWIPGSFNSWSPALVTWYQGQGWIGWTPRGPGSVNHHRGGEHCPNGACLVAVSTRTFQDGSPVRVHRITGVRPESGSQISRPGVLPTRAGMLTGRTISPRSITKFGALSHARSVQLGTTGKTGASAVGASQRASAPRAPARDFGSQGQRSSGIVYDRNEGRFVNGSGRTSAPAHATSASGASSGGAIFRTEPRPGAPSRSAGPSRSSAPRPVSVAAPSGLPNFERGHSASPRSGVVHHESGRRSAPSWSSGGARPSSGRQQSYGSRSTYSPSSSRSYGGASSSGSSGRSYSPPPSAPSGGGNFGGGSSSPAPRGGGGHHATPPGRP